MRWHSSRSYGELAQLNLDNEPILSSSFSWPYYSRRIRRHLPRPPTMFGLARFLTLRRLLVVVSCLCFSIVAAILCSGIPSNFHRIRDAENQLPQHSALVPGRKYLRFPGYLWGHGFNNVFQEHIVMAYLAYEANRSFVFEDYVWSHIPFPYTLYDFALRPTRMPLNAFISGASAGGPMEGREAVSATFWEEVCPPQRRHTLSPREAPKDADGSSVIRWWTEKLSDSREACLQIGSSNDVQALFDRFFFGGFRFLSLWPELSSSPILTRFAWSTLVQSAVARNRVLLDHGIPLETSNSSAISTVFGLVALHIRQGDYKRHCPFLAQEGAMYMGINQLPSLPDKFDPSLFAKDDSKRKAYYLEHCLPTVKQIVLRMRAVRRDSPHLRRVYVLTNAWGWWVSRLARALRLDGWEDVKSSLDLELDAEERHIAVAVDMSIAEKADVFVGNGFSSLTSNVVMLRMAKGLNVTSNRFL
ncbi:hypothetical protein HGRIS_007225 [Hohenbuehelia grisea]|uniref:Uncharacterized protein n=1 Tax=Hohenbuehelia grisea TaxID=104357 RepID=A0ABR3JBQ4_9AGAR